MELLILIYIFSLGAILGSFFNVVIYRLPRKLSIAKGTSFCPKCEHRIMPLELVPILSYVFLKGRCAHCHEPISIRYPLIETLTGIIFLISYLHFGFNYQTIIAMILGSLCLIIAMIDFDTMEIYDRFHVFILFLALIHIAFFTTLPIFDHLIGFFIISVPFYILAIITGGIGGGDIKLMAVSGLLLGYQAILVAFFIGAILGGSVAIVLLALKKSQMKSLIAFGPYLAIGIFIAYLVGIQVFEWYISLLI